MIFFRFSINSPYCGIGATIRIGREMLCLPYAGFFFKDIIRTPVNVFPFYNLLFMSQHKSWIELWHSDSVLLSKLYKTAACGLIISWLELKTKNVTVFWRGMIRYVVLCDPGYIKFSHILEQFPRDWETTMHRNVVLTISTHKIYVTMRGKLSELRYNVSLVSNRGQKVMKRRKIMGQICPIAFLAFLTFFTGLENNQTSKFGFDNFPRMVTYILCVENCQKYILMHSCLPIAGGLF